MSIGDLTIYLEIYITKERNNERTNKKTNERKKKSEKFIFDVYKSLTGMINKKNTILKMIHGVSILDRRKRECGTEKDSKNQNNQGSFYSLYL